MKKILWAFILLATGAAQAADGDVVYVDFDRVYRESKVVRAVSDDINVEFRERDDLLQEAREKIKTMRETLEKESLTLSEAERAETNAEIAKLEREFIRDRRAFAEDRGLRFQERRSVIDSEIERIIENLAKERGYRLVLNPYILLPTGGRELTHSILLYADEGADITSEVVNLFDQQAKISR